MGSRRLEPPGDDLLPGAATALEASGATPAEPPPDEGPGPAIEPRDYPPAAPPRRRGRPPGSKNRPKPAPVEAAITPAGEVATAGEGPADVPPATPPAAPPRRRGRPPGSKNRPKPPSAAADAVAASPPATGPGPGPGEAAASPGVPPAAARRRGRPPGRAGTARRPAATPSARRDRLTIEQIVAVESPREPRLSPDGRRVAYTQEAAGARQVFLLGLRTGQVRQLTASEKNVTDPQWAPDGERLAFVRETAIWMVGADGSRPTLVTDHPAGNKAPRWSPDGRRIAFISRRRGWGQAWVVDAPLPRRGRRPARETAGEPRAVSPVGWDVEEISWSPDGTQLAVLAQRDPDLRTFQVTLVEVATGAERRIAGDGAWETAATWLPDGQGLLLVSDRDGWFQVVRIATDGGGRTVLTEGSAEHGDYGAGFGSWPLASPDGSRFVHALIRDGRQDLVVAPLPAGPGPTALPRRPGRPPRARPVTPAWSPRSIAPFPGVWLAVAWLPDGSGLLAVGESEREAEDLWILPAPGPDGTPTADRPRRLTTSRPAVLPATGFVESEHHVIRARDGRAVPFTLWRPPAGHRAPGREHRPDDRPRSRRPDLARSTWTGSLCASSSCRRASPSSPWTSAAPRAMAASTAGPTSTNGATGTSTT